jgi:hypothetical protein
MAGHGDIKDNESGIPLKLRVDPCPAEERPGPFFYCCMVVLVVLLVIAARYALMFAEAANNQ